MTATQLQPGCAHCSTSNGLMCLAAACCPLKWLTGCGPNCLLQCVNGSLYMYTCRCKPFLRPFQWILCSCLVCAHSYCACVCLKGSGSEQRDAACSNRGEGPEAQAQENRACVHTKQERVLSPLPPFLPFAQCNGLTHKLPCYPHIVVDSLHIVACCCQATHSDWITR